MGLPCRQAEGLSAAQIKYWDEHLTSQGSQPSFLSPGQKALDLTKMGPDLVIYNQLFNAGDEIPGCGLKDDMSDSITDALRSALTTPSLSTRIITLVAHGRPPHGATHHRAFYENYTKLSDAGIVDPTAHLAAVTAGPGGELVAFRRGYITPADVYERVFPLLEKGKHLIFIIDACFSGYWVDHLEAHQHALSKLPGKVTIQSSADHTPSTNVFATAWQKLQQSHGSETNPGAGSEEQNPRLFTTDSIQQETEIAVKIRNFWFFRDGSVTLKYHGTNRSANLKAFEALASIQ